MVRYSIGLKKLIYRDTCWYSFHCVALPQALKIFATYCYIIQVLNETWRKGNTYLSNRQNRGWMLTVRLEMVSYKSEVGEFQSTHPHGVRPHNGVVNATDFKFQSTHPHGVRRTLQYFARKVAKFQSTHPHGVRHSERCYKMQLNLFQSTHPHGVRLKPCIE